MSTSTRPTLTVRVSALESDLRETQAGVNLLLAHFGLDQPAKVTAPKAPAKKAPAKRKPAKKVTAKAPTKGAQTLETLSRKEWNRTLTAKAKLAGGDTYKRVLADWNLVQSARNAQYTPDQALGMFFA